MLFRRGSRAIVRRRGVLCTWRVGRKRVGVARFGLYRGCSRSGSSCGVWLVTRAGNTRCRGRRLAGGVCRRDSRVGAVRVGGANGGKSWRGRLVRNGSCRGGRLEVRCWLAACLLPEDWIVTETVSFRLSAVVAGWVCLVALEWRVGLEKGQQTAKTEYASAKDGVCQRTTRIKNMSAPSKLPIDKKVTCCLHVVETRWGGALVEEGQQWIC